ncbi:MAG: hypothetical protein AB8G15_11820 [Saprospiraceae bacterium]
MLDITEEEENNNFKELEEEEIEEFEFPEAEVLNNIQAEVNGFRFVGDTFGTFFTRIIGVIVSLLGGKPEDNQ